MNEFKPGDHVAHPEYGHGLVQRKGWVGFEGRDLFLPAVATDLRRLAVIDPEDREQVERLAKAHHFAVGFARWDALHPNTRRDLTDAMKTALRAGAEPPKPEEPTGIGAVVEDARGERWVRNAAGADGNHWLRVGPPTLWATWFDIDVVRVLSEGVQP